MGQILANKESGLIYKITNLVNGKIYIGQTRNSLEHRWKEHIWHYNPSMLIRKAIKKYGKNSFSIEKIAEANSRAELDMLEKHHIKEAPSLSPIGYNIKEGGEGGGLLSKEGKALLSLAHSCEFTPVVQLTREFKLIKKFAAMNDAGRDLNVSVGHISKCCRGLKNYKTVGGFVWLYEKDFESGNFNTDIKIYDHGVHISMMKNGIVLKTFQSATQASRETGIHRPSILKCCNKEKFRHQAGGYEWRYA